MAHLEVVPTTDPTQAKSVRLSAYRTTRRYSWPPLEPHEFTVASVTSAIKGGLPKDHLVGWAAKKTAECAVSDYDIIGAMLKKGDKKAALQHLKGSRYRDMNAKGDRGTIVHAAIDAYIMGKPFSKEEMQRRLEEADVPKSMWVSTAGMIAGAMEFLWDTEPEIYHNEATMYNRTHQYAGTVDLLCKLHIGGTKQNAVVDFKTSAAIYDEVALQLVAYARAEFVGLNDGTEAPVIPKPAKATVKQLKEWSSDINYGIVVRPKADGSYERADFTLNDDVFELFLHVLGTCMGTENDVLARSKRPTVQ